LYGEPLTELRVELLVVFSKAPYRACVKHR
jgi:hypothetical protein